MISIEFKFPKIYWVTRERQTQDRRRWVTVRRNIFDLLLLRFL